jgi:hypothetical protein
MAVLFSTTTLNSFSRSLSSSRIGREMTLDSLTTLFNNIITNQFT